LKMMFLMEKEGEDDKIVSNPDLSWELEQGWRVVKPLPDCPSSIKQMQVGKRSVKEIEKWYDWKIKEHRGYADNWEQQLKRFKQLLHTERK
jgi:hypothetical protein